MNFSTQQVLDGRAKTFSFRAKKEINSGAMWKIILIFLYYDKENSLFVNCIRSPPDKNSQEFCLLF